MNMPVVDTYGTQQPIALLKLLVERGGFYDRGKDLNWKTIKDTSTIVGLDRTPQKKSYEFGFKKYVAIENLFFFFYEALLIVFAL